MFSTGDQLYDSALASDTKCSTPRATLAVSSSGSRTPDVEHPTPLPRALDRALFATLAAAGKLLGLGIPRNSRTPGRAADEG